MTTAQKSVLALAIVGLAGLAYYQVRVIQGQRSALGERETSLAALRAAPPRTAPAPFPTPASVPAARPAASVPPSVTVPPERQRVDLLRQLLSELTAQGLPELKLLSPEDWLAIARAHELDTAADIRVALADLRALARKKFGEMLQEALRRFTDSSGGQLPIDAGQLLSYLPPSADAAMLARYEITRTGRLGEASERFLREKPTSDMILAVGIDGWGLTNNSALPPAFGETEGDAINRVWRALGTALGDEAKEKMAQMASPAALGAVMEEGLKSLEPIYGDRDALGVVLKQSVRDFLASHPTETITDMGQVLPFLKDSEKFIAAIRPTLVQLEYFSEHDGQLPPNAAAWEAQLARPFNPVEALRLMKLQWDGEHLEMTYNYSMPTKP